MHPTIWHPSPMWCMVATVQALLSASPMLCSRPPGLLGKAVLSKSPDGLCSFCQGSCHLLQVRTQKDITVPISDIIKVFLHFFFFFIIKSRYFSALRFNRFSKRSQQRFHHCTLKQTFQKSSLWFSVSCKTNTRGQLLLSLATLAHRCSWPALAHKALDQGEMVVLRIL